MDVRRCNFRAVSILIPLSHAALMRPRGPTAAAAAVAAHTLPLSGEHTFAAPARVRVRPPGTLSFHERRREGAFFCPAWVLRSAVREIESGKVGLLDLISGYLSSKRDCPPYPPIQSITLGRQIRARSTFYSENGCGPTSPPPPARTRPPDPTLPSQPSLLPDRSTAGVAKKDQGSC